MKSMLSVALVTSLVLHSALAAEQVSVSLSASSGGFAPASFSQTTTDPRLSASINSGPSAASGSANSSTRTATARASDGARTTDGTDAAAQATFTSSGTAPFRAPRRIYLVYDYTASASTASAANWGGTFSEMTINVSDGATSFNISSVVIGATDPAICFGFTGPSSTLGCFATASRQTTGSIAVNTQPTVPVQATMQAGAYSGTPGEAAASSVRLRWSATPVGAVYDPYLVGP